jgi:hypothetical protein
MTENEKLKARLENTEKAVFALATVIGDYLPPQAQNDTHYIMNAYFDANTSLGFVPSVAFKSAE